MEDCGKARDGASSLPLRSGVLSLPLLCLQREGRGERMEDGGWKIERGTSAPARRRCYRAILQHRAHWGQRLRQECLRPLTDQRSIPRPWPSSVGSTPLVSPTERHRMAQPFNQIAEPSNQIAEPFNQIAEPFDQIVEPFNQIAEPSNQIVEPFNQMAEPSNQIAGGPALLHSGECSYGAGGTLNARR